MKIIFVNRFYFPDESATAQILRDLAEFLVTRQYDVTVICSRYTSQARDTVLKRRENVAGVSIVRVGFRSFSGSRMGAKFAAYVVFTFAAALALLKSAGPGSCVVAKTDPPLLGVAIGLISRIRGFQLINWIQDLFPEVLMAHSKARGVALLGSALKPMRNWSLGVAAQNVVLGQAMHDRLIEQGISSSAISIIPNWADGATLRPEPREENEFRARWNLQNSFVVCYSGNFGRVHKLDSILEMASSLICEERVVFLLIGGGPQREHIEREASDLRLRNVIFQPFQPRRNLSSSLNCADLHVSSLKAEMEGLVFPSKISGALAVGRPVLHIGDPKGEIGQFLRSNSCGESYDARDIHGMCEFVLMLLSNPGRLADLSTNARKTFLQELNLPLSASKWQSLIAGLDKGESRGNGL